MQAKLNIIVTGSTSGIGLATVKNRAKRNDRAYHIFVTSRKLANAKATIEELSQELPNTTSIFTALELDLGNRWKVDAFVEGLETSGTKIDILVNNAGINLFERPNESKEKFLLQWNVNYAHTRYLTEQVLEKDLITNSGKIINVSSEIGNFSQFEDINPDLYAQLKKFETFDMETVAEIENLFLSDFETIEGQAQWPQWVSGTTKFFLNLFTIILSKDPRVVERDIQVYSMCPGFCKTNLTMGLPFTVTRTSDQGCQTILYLIHHTRSIGTSRAAFSQGRRRALTFPLSLITTSKS